MPPAIPSTGGTEGILIIGTVVLVFMAAMVLWWLRTTLSLDAKNCTQMQSVNSKSTLLTSINPQLITYKYLVRDYYVKTAYNCCAAGQYKNDFVNLCALKTCIKQGVRCLDFAVYSVEKLPVIAISSLTDYNVKESFNSLPFLSAMQTIADNAFSASTCPNPADPLFLHFRILSKNAPIYKIMAQNIADTLSDRLLGSGYSHEFSSSGAGQNLGALALSKFVNKVIIIVDKTNALYSTTALDEYVNIASNSRFMRSLRAYDVRYCPDVSELTEFNKKNMSICFPDLDGNVNNISALLPQQYGCQFIAMSFQRNDPAMTYYKKIFDDNGTAFILKTAKLRFTPSTIPDPTQPNPAVAQTVKPIALGGISDVFSNLKLNI